MYVDMRIMHVMWLSNTILKMAKRTRNVICCIFIWVTYYIEFDLQHIMNVSYREIWWFLMLSIILAQVESKFYIRTNLVNRGVWITDFPL